MVLEVFLNESDDELRLGGVDDDEVDKLGLIQEFVHEVEVAMDTYFGH